MSVSIKSMFKCIRATAYNEAESERILFNLEAPASLLSVSFAMFKTNQVDDGYSSRGYKKTKAVAMTSGQRIWHRVSC